MENFRLIIPEFVSVNHYLNYKIKKIKKGNRDSFVPIPFKKPSTVAFEKRLMNYLKREMKNQSWETPSKDKKIIVECTFFFKEKGMDANNYYKVMFDVFTKAKIWHDDSMAMERVLGIYVDKINPRIEINIKIDESIGIFKNKEELEKFKNKNCETCRKSKKCGTIKEFLDNKIHNLEEDYICKKYIKRKK